MTGIALKSDNTWQRVNYNGDNLSVTNFDNVWPWSRMESVLFGDTTTGAWVKKIPKFYYRLGVIEKGPLAGCIARWLSPIKLPWYHIYPAFVKNNRVMDCFYFAQYYTGQSGNTSISLAGVAPTAQNTLEGARQLCSQRGNDWHLHNYYEICALYLLMMIENGTPKWKEVYGATTGGTTYRGAVQPTGSSSIVYRDIYDLSGNAFAILDGFYVDNDVNINIFDRKMDGTFINTNINANNLWPASGYSPTLLTNKGDGYDLGDVFVPEKPKEGSSIWDIFFQDNRSITGSDSWVNFIQTGNYSDEGHCDFTMTAGSHLPRAYSSVVFTRMAKDGNITDEIAYPD